MLVPRRRVRGQRHVSLVARRSRRLSVRGGTGTKMISPLQGLQRCNKSPCVLHAREVQGRGRGWKWIKWPFQELGALRLP